MTHHCGAGPLTFKIFLTLGFLLAVALLGQSILTYIDVTGTVSSQAAARNPEPRWTARTTLAATRPLANNPWKPARMDFAAYWESVTEAIQSLRQNLIIEILASLAFLATLLILALRFPRYVRGLQIQQQVDLAWQVQSDLLPPGDLDSPDFEFASECSPAGDVSGDFCDVFRIAGDRSAFVLGDVSGKGISAALLMALIHGAIQSIGWTRCAAEHENATRNLNALLCRKTARERFSTLFWGYYDPETSVLRYINAGHLPPLLVRCGEFGNLEVQRLEEGGPVLGVLPDARYTQGQLTLRKGDLLVAFSDGIVETTNSSGEEFGERRILDAIRAGWKDSVGSIRTRVLERAEVFANPKHASDDRTLLAVRFKHGAEHPALVASPGEECSLVAL